MAYEKSHQTAKSMRPSMANWFKKLFNFFYSADREVERDKIRKEIKDEMLTGSATLDETAPETKQFIENSIIDAQKFLNEVRATNARLLDDRLRTIDGTILAVLEMRDYCVISNKFCIPILNEVTTKKGKPKVFFEA